MTEKEHLSIDHLVNRYVAKLGKYNAGLSIEGLKARFQVDRVAKLGSNENPFPTSSSVMKALSRAGDLSHYPDANCSLLRKKIADKLTVAEESLVFGNGSEDLISIISRALINEGDKVMTIVPSFGLHILYPTACGAKMVIAPMTAQLEFDIERITSLLRSEKPKLFFIASPSNPVGCSLSQDDVNDILANVSEQTLLVFDEAYYEYAQGELDYPDVLALLKASGKPFVLLRTLSKAYSLAGLRIGYGVFYPVALAEYMNKVRTPFNVNRQAQVAAIAALDDDNHLEKTIHWNHIARKKMQQDLKRLGVSPYESKGNFLFFSTSWLATDLADKLLKFGVIVKPWMEPGYEYFVRVSIGKAEDNQLFITSLASLLGRTALSHVNQ